ncbi:DUF2267 domain-containing protein [Leptolyngbya cf. ectocarpi LEGE 11479]|uniref:DUF2267 domain-containing protein n=1 Tax=Leptolyngbya cf. ectocarpi LEGE 11479 TaxID=1828722 RepID=A0A928X2Z0_LEPEC|nr:DUF2267 domain-containing protein [Leptolyngbya ectocarpi]MBE9065588.1 DUF2267 domain-containing protein [Leptolyngbya cf. ectocarpi LEGE 11479]
MPSKSFSPAEKAFLEKVMQKASLPDIYDARDLTIVVFRSLRDLMTTEAAERTQETLDDEKIALLWKDDNPIVAALAKLRPPLKVDTETFLRRIQQEGGVPKGSTPEGVVIAVFSTIREELPPERVQEISSFLPDGLKIMWDQV